MSCHFCGSAWEGMHYCPERAEAKFEYIQAALANGRRFEDIAPTVEVSRVDYEKERAARAMKAALPASFSSPVTVAFVDALAAIIGEQFAELAKLVDDVKRCDKDESSYAKWPYPPEVKVKSVPALIPLGRVLRRESNLVTVREENDVCGVYCVSEYSAPIEIGAVVFVENTGKVFAEPRVTKPNARYRPGSPEAEAEALASIAGVSIEVEPPQMIGVQQVQLPGKVQEITVQGRFDLGPSKCDCGAEKCRTTHADWCSAR